MENFVFFKVSDALMIVHKNQLIRIPKLSQMISNNINDLHNPIILKEDSLTFSYFIDALNGKQSLIPEEYMNDVNKLMEKYGVIEQDLSLKTGLVTHKVLFSNGSASFEYEGEIVEIVLCTADVKHDRCCLPRSICINSVTIPIDLYSIWFDIDTNYGTFRLKEKYLSMLDIRNSLQISLTDHIESIYHFYIMTKMT